MLSTERIDQRRSTSNSRSMRVAAGYLALVAALLITATVWPFIYVMNALFVTVANIWVSYWTVGLGAVTLVVAGLVAFGSISTPSNLRRMCLVFALGIWSVSLLIVGGSYVSGEVPFVISASLLYLSSLWNFAIGWIILWPSGWRTKFRTVAYMFVFPIIGWRLFVPSQLTGDEQVQLRWRWSASRSAPVVSTRPVPDQASPLTIDGIDFPQFLGPNRDGRVAGPPLNPDWSTFPPELIWKIPVGSGWGGFALVGDMAITQEQRGENEAIVAYRLADGSEVWAHQYAAHYEASPMGDGPRATPTIMGDQVFAFGATGVLHRLDRANGRPVWSRDILKDVGARLQLHGASSSPLLVNDMVIVAPSGESGPTLMACSQKDGTTVWQVGESGPVYGSPLLVKKDHEELVLHADSKGLFARRSIDGQIAWSYPHSMEGLISQPIFWTGDFPRVLLASYDLNGATMLQIDSNPNQPTMLRPLWTKPVLKTKFATPVALGEHVYGLDNGILQCVSAKNGGSLWKKGRYKHGHLLLVNELLIVLTEDGEVVLVRPNADGLEELGRIEAIEGKTWNPISIKGRYLVVRNSTQAACYRLAVVP